MILEGGLVIDAIQAVKIAEGKLPEVVPAFAALKPFVEEIEQSKDGHAWLVTFRARNPKAHDEGGFGSFREFVEKVVRVEAASGDLLSVLNPSYD